MAASQADSGPWTVARLLGWTRDYLAQQGVESPRLCSEILLAHALGCDRLRLFTQYESEPDSEVRDRFRLLVKQAAAGTPIAYLIGYKEFFSLRFDVTPAVLIPRPDTETLVERTVSLVRQGDGSARILDIGTGSGCIAISLAKHLPEAKICASDISEEALAVARANAERHEVADRVDFRAGDLLAPWSGATFDLLISNPPYIAEQTYAELPATIREHEPAQALRAGRDGLDVIRALLAAAPAHLVDGGHLLLEVAHDQSDAVRALLAENGWTDTLTYRDGGGHQRVVHTRRAADCSQVA